MAATQVRLATIDFNSGRLAYTAPGATRRRELGIDYDSATVGTNRVAACRRVFAGSMLKIPGRSERVVRVPVDRIADNTDVVFVPADAAHMNMSGVAAAPTVAWVRDRHIRVPIMNITGQRQKIRPLKDIGNWTPLDPDVHCLESIDLKDPASVVARLRQLRPHATPGRRRQHDGRRRQREWLGELFRLYPRLFADNPKCPDVTTKVQHRIDTGTHASIQRRRLLSPRRRHHSKEIAVMLKNDVIEPCNGEWGFPVAIVRKKDGTARFCVDYRELNVITRKDVYPLPRIDEALDWLGGCNLFSTLDLASGYWQVLVVDTDRDKTAVITKYGTVQAHAFRPLQCTRYVPTTDG